MATIKLKDESTKTFSIDGVCYTKGDYRLQYNAKKEVLIIPKAVANISNLSGLPFKNPTAWTYFVDADDNPYGSFEEFSLAISDAINFNTGEATPQYKVYTALLTQSGTSNPTATVLENTLGQTITWSYNGVGVYSSSDITTATQNNLYIQFSHRIASKIASAHEHNTGGASRVNILQIEADLITPVDSLEKGYIEIRVYN